MIDLDFKFHLKVGGVSIPSQSSNKLGFLGKVSIPFKKLANIVEYLKDDADIMPHRYTYSEGRDAYSILLNREFPVGIYHNENNLDEYFYKTYDMQGNSIAGFVIGESSAHNTVHRMVVLETVPSDTLVSRSIAEVFLTNCYENGIDPYIELATTFSDTGVGFVWYGRNSRFTPIEGYVNPDHSNFAVEFDGINEWLAEYIEEEQDIIDINKLREMEEIVVKKPRKRRKK